MKYSDVCEAKTKADMVARFNSLCAEVAKEHGGDPAAHRLVQLSNVSYFAGYYDSETYERVMGWLGGSHPVFGKSYPNPSKAMAAGRKAAKERP